MAHEDAHAPLPPELRAFIHSCIESIEQVETLMLLRGSERSRTVRDVSTMLRVPLPTARRDLDTLATTLAAELAKASELLNLDVGAGR